MNRRLVILLAVAAVAALLVLLDGGAPQEAVVEAVERSGPAPVPRADSPARTANAEPAIARLIPREQLIGDEDEALGRGNPVFGTQNWNPPPPPPSNEPAPPPPKPSAPPLPFTYLGKAQEKGVWEVYLARADQTYVVKDKTVIDGLYRVEAIAPPTLTLTYLPLNQVQTLNIGVLE